jgi:hypothetical protein
MAMHRQGLLGKPGRRPAVPARGTGGIDLPKVHQHNQPPLPLLATVGDLILLCRQWRPEGCPSG